MKTLLQSLVDADRICKEANTHFEAEAAIQQQAAHRQANITKARICWIVGGFVLLSAIGDMIGSHSGLNLVASVAVTTAMIFGYRAHKKFINTAVSTLLQQAQDENAAGVKVLEDNIDDIAFLPDDYWYPLATGYLVKMIQTNRAETLPAALDLFDAQLHRWKIEEANAEMVAQQRAQTEHLNSIRKSSKVNAAANVANTMFNIAKEFS